MGMKLEQCTRCQGFLPPKGAACPHCRATAAPPSARMRAGSLARRVRLGALGGALGGGAIAFTLMACYGAPPCADGSRDCYKNTPSPETSGSPKTPPTATPEGTADAGK